MKKQIDLVVNPEIGLDDDNLREYVIKKLKVSDPNHFSIQIVKRSIDARSQNVKIRLSANVFIDEPEENRFKKTEYPNVKKSKQVVVVGAGPAGLFAALRLIELGYKPIVLERGKDVQSRRRDLAAINKEHIVNPESNYCFGEGGAGTYSDGKLYTRSKKRGDVRRILEILVAHGSRDEILYDAHPHIGTNKLPKIVENLRESINNSGGEVLFDSKVTDFVIKEGELEGVVLQNGNKIIGEGVILATGHSARDIYELLHHKNIKIEAKPFALGVRAEHQQQLIDQIQYHCETDRGDYLPAAPYSMVHQATFNKVQRGVFSFCMCPGGFIVPSATNPGEVVVNGMSPSRRDSEFANSGIVVAVGEEDYLEYRKYGPLAGMYFQRDIEQKACEIAGGRQTAPAQRLVDFVKGKVSDSLLATSYQPGIVSVDLREVLPEFIWNSLQQGFQAFGRKMKGYYTNEAQIVGVESRTSSPIRIPRDRITFEHVELKRLYPCAEGAGYAGGIVSAAMDGERCAEKLVEKYLS
ncbi:MAG: FAD-binding protein [Cyclobacteriaceae bacterium]|nr:FAD-binding protein [Cyclobacteriaceae bacterium]